jgi:hypothetical protein
MQGTRIKKLAVVTALACLASAVVVGLSAAAPTKVKKGPIVVTFNGGISPRSLPRSGSAPVGVQMGGKITTSDHANPPILKRIILDINRKGVIQTKGLGRCSLGKLKNASQAGAKRSCADAIVGKGSVTSRVRLPEQSPFASIGSMVAFNGRYKGHQAVFAQVASGAPLPLTYVIVFVVKKTKGTFGTKMIGTLPEIASSYGHITAFNLSLRRTYRFHGRRMSFASASCPAPKGLHGAQFALARVGYEFEGGPNMDATLIRRCNVRG